jgi:transposase-like protein
MTQRSPLTPEERAKIVSLLKEGGLSQGAIARVAGRAQSTISSVAAQEGLSAPRHKTPVQANHARRVYAREQRRELLDRFLSLAEAMIDAGGMSPREIRELAQGIGTAIEKRRLEDDEAGSITETRSGHPQHGALDLEEVFRKLDEQIEEEHRQEQERLSEEQRREEELREQQEPSQ